MRKWANRQAGKCRLVSGSVGESVRVPFKTLFAVGCALLATAVVSAQLPSLAEQAVAYSKTAATDPVAQLQKKVDAGEVELVFDEAHGYLPAVLDALNVPKSSQGLVFSRTSLQVDRIAPLHGRVVPLADLYTTAGRPLPR